MAYTLFLRREHADAPATEFAATVLSMPPGFGDGTPDPRDRRRPAAAAGAPAPEPSPAGPLTEPGADSLPAPVDASVEARPTLSFIGRYAIKGLLGEGGLGRVHEAWDPLLSRTVAIKTLQFELDTPDRISLDGLILNEARAAAGLSHPHIVTVHDAGLSAHGVYVAMERLHGSDLRHRLASGWRPTPGQAAQLVRRVADALAYAHARGVVHCDIKPANIFLGGRDKPKVLDFGIARVASGTVLPALDGLVAGSPHYLAPEQLQGGTVDARTDIHALGVVFYELLTGRKAYGGNSVEQITAAVLTHDPAPAHLLRPGISPTLSAIAARAMARDPAARYAGADEMAGDLRRWIDRQSASESGARTVPARGGGRPAPAAGARSALLQGAGLLAGGIVLAVALTLEGDRASASGRPVPAAGSDAAPVAAPATPDATVLPPAGTRTDAAPAIDPAAGAGTGVSAADGPSPAVEPRPATTTAARPRAPTAAVPPRSAAPRPRSPAAAPAATVAAPSAAAATGALQLAISPWGTVEVDGIAAGTAPPLTRLSLPEGSHTITVRNADFPPHTATVQVSAERPVTVRHRFGP